MVRDGGQGPPLMDWIGRGTTAILAHEELELGRELTIATRTCLAR